MGAYLHWIVKVEKVVHPPGARWVTVTYKRALALKNLVGYMVLYYNATKSCICDTGMLVEVEPHNRQICDSGV